MMKKLLESGFKVTATKEGRKMAKEAFRKAFRKFKKADKKERVPYDLIKADLKRKIKGTKLITQAEIKANPGSRRRIMLRIARDKKQKSKFKGPIIYGKAYQSDKAGKGLQIPMISKQQRRDVQEDISQSVRKFLKKKLGRKKGGDIKVMKSIAKKLDKASRAHKGQSKRLKRIVSKYV
jgi:hypothetical protein